MGPRRRTIDETVGLDLEAVGPASIGGHDGVRFDVAGTLPFLWPSGVSGRSNRGGTAQLTYRLHAVDAEGTRLVTVVLGSSSLWDGRLPSAEAVLASIRFE